METNPLKKRYKTRSTTAESVAKSHVDWRRTKRYIFPESQDDDDEITSSSSTSSSSSSSEEEEEENPKSSSKEDVDGKEEETSILSKRNSEAGSDTDFQKGDVSSEDPEEGNISFGKRKRLRAAVIYDSDESSDSDVPRKVIAKGRNLISEDDLSVDGESPTSPAEKAANKKRERHIKLQELSFRQSRKSGKVNQHDEGSVDDDLVQYDVHSLLAEEEISDVSDNDSMKDFISNDDDEEEEREEEQEEKKLEWGNFKEEEHQHQDRKPHEASNLLEKRVQSVSEVNYYLHFQIVVKAFLINAIDDTFLSSLYEGKRQKRYAKDMLTSLDYLDHRIIQPRLSLVSGCRWKERYMTRVDSYSDVRIISQCSEMRICEACELDRDCKFIVVFSGKQYDPITLKVDDFLSHDIQRLKVGVVCQKRTQVYHNLKHYKYKLYQKCCSAIKEEYRQDEPAKELVKRVFSQLNEDNWICKEYSVLESYLDETEEFHEFLKDFKREIHSFVQR